MESNNIYENSITKVNYIINKLPLDSLEKIPECVINFFEEYSNSELLQNSMLKTNNIMNQLNINDLKFLKIVDYYINK